MAGKPEVDPIGSTSLCFRLPLSRRGFRPTPRRGRFLVGRRPTPRQEPFEKGSWNSKTFRGKGFWDISVLTKPVENGKMKAVPESGTLKGNYIR